MSNMSSVSLFLCQKVIGLLYMNALNLILTLTFQPKNEYGSFSGHGQHMCEVIFIIVFCQLSYNLIYN